MSVRIHDLLEIDAQRFLQAQSSVPGWVAESLRETPFVVVRRGSTEQGIPVGVRGPARNERWAGVCDAKIIRAIVTPQMLLTSTISAGQSLLHDQTPLPHASQRQVATATRPPPSTARSASIPALRALSLLTERWRELNAPWGPGGSVGFELATSRHVTTPQSDLDIVIYAGTPMTASQAQTLRDSAQGLPAAVDIRVETPICSFSLTEYASRFPAPILLRLASGTVLGADPWAAPNLTSSPCATATSPTACRPAAIATNRPDPERPAPTSAGRTSPDPVASRPATAASK